MTKVEFMKEKNKILRETLGMDFDLVPEDQMVETEGKQMKLGIKRVYESCPYCSEFLGNDCEGCPMFKAGNACDEDGTWRDYTVHLNNNGFEVHNSEDSPAYQPIKKLVERYNKEIKK